MSQVLDFIKAHAFALACAAVALVGMIAYFVYPIPGMFATLESEVKARGGVYSSIDATLSAPRTLPNVSLDHPEPPKLEYFPTNRIIEQGNGMLKKLSDEATRVLETAVQRNERKPLIADALPNGSPLARNQFLNKYKEATAQFGADAEKGIIRTILKGALPPSDEELTLIGNQRAAQISQKKLQFGPNNQAVNQPEVDAEIAAMRAALPALIRAQRGFSSQMFVSPDAVAIHTQLRGTQLPDNITVFNGQFSFWIQCMVFESLVAANKGATSIYDAPIRHLVRLEVPMDFVSGAGLAAPIGFGGDPSMSGDPAAAAAAPAAAVELKPDASATIAPAYARDPLGYVSNPLYDPIHVRMILRVDVSKLPDVLAAMQTAKLLKVKNVNMRTVDKGVAMSEGYIYDADGSTPLVEVALDCDVLILRQWLVKYMSNPVKQFFMTLSTPAAAAPPG